MSKGIEVKESKLAKDLEKLVVEIVQDAFETKTQPKERAEKIKKELDNSCEQYWHVIIGKQFTTFVTYETDKYCHLVHGGSTAIQVFKCGN